MLNDCRNDSSSLLESSFVIPNVVDFLQTFCDTIMFPEPSGMECGQTRLFIGPTVAGNETQMFRIRSAFFLLESLRETVLEILEFVCEIQLTFKMFTIFSE